MEKKKIMGVIECLLFASGDPLKISKLEKITEATNKEIEEAVKALSERYLFDKQGMILIRKEGEIQMVTNPDYSEFADKLMKGELQESLSQAALEVISIIAYRGPIARVGIEAIRGVNCSYTLRNLLLRGLIEREGNFQDNRGYVYKMSFEFMKKIGLNDMTKLPDYEKLSKDERIKDVIQ